MENAVRSTKKTFLSGVFLLTLSTLLVKVIGLLYKIPMLSRLGAEGMGYFNSAYEIYALFCIVSTAGLPVALSVMISAALAKGDSTGVRRIYRAALTVFFIIGLIGSAVMWAGAGWFCRLIRSEKAYGCIVSISPTVFLICVSSALRGYFQGYQRMLQTAVSQLIEAVGKLAFGLLLVRYALAMGYGLPTVAAFAGWGLTLGEAAALAYLLAEKVRFRPAAERAGNLPLEENSGLPRIWGQLAKLAIPMTLGASLLSFTKLIDMTMILRRLQSIGYTEAAANRAYGSYTTLALSIYGLLPSLINAVTLPLVPILSAAIASGEQKKQTQMVELSYRLTALFAIPASLGIAAFAKPVLSLLFSGDPEAIDVASPLLSLLGVSVFLSCMISATNSVLHAYRAVNKPLLSMLAGAGIKMTLAFFLIGNPSVAMVGAPVSTFFCNAVVVLLNLYFAAGLCGDIPVFGIFLRPVLASAAAVGISYGLYLTVSARAGETAVLTAAMLALTAVLYLLLILLFGGVKREDVEFLPMGERLSRFLTKMKLIR